MKQTIAIIENAIQQFPAACVAVSGGGDSTVLLDILARRCGLKIPVVHNDTGMEYPETWAHVQALARRYGLDAIRAQPAHTPEEQWRRTGWPMWGKLAARKWQISHKGRDMGFTCNVGACCRSIKIAPARREMRRRGFLLCFDGQRGGQDDRIRHMQQNKYGALSYVEADKLWICHPLQGWTDLMIRRYTAEHDLPRHPAKERGAITIGCVYCGGGAQFTNSGFRVLRRTAPDLWRRYMVELGAGEIVLACRYDQPLPTVRAAIETLGGLERLAEEKPWLFDYLVKTPIPGYQR